MDLQDPFQKKYRVIALQDLKKNSQNYSILNIKNSKKK